MTPKALTDVTLKRFSVDGLVPSFTLSLLLFSVAMSGSFGGFGDGAVLAAGVGGEPSNVGAGNNLPLAASQAGPTGAVTAVNKNDPDLVLAFAEKHRVPARVAKSLLRALGGAADEDELTLVADLGSTSEEQVQNAVKDMVFEEGGNPSALHRGSALRLWRASVSYAKLQGYGDHAESAVAEAVAPVVVSAAPPAPAQRKLADVLDQGDDGNFVPLNMDELTKIRERHVEVTGAEPPQDERPSADQLAALKSKLGAGKCPYVDLGLFGPFGDRTAKLRKFQAQIWVDGELTTKFVGGPRTFEAWKSSWAVFRAAMIMLDVCTPSALDKYARGLERLISLHGHWDMLMVIDEKCRGEQWDILAEQCARKNPEGYSPTKPWQYIINESAYSPTGGALAEWWYYSFVAPVTYKIAAPLKSSAEFEGSAGTTVDPVPLGGKGAGRGRGSGGASGKARPIASSAASSGSSRICMAWNRGGCKDDCSGGNRHVCSICGGAHRATECGSGKGSKGKGAGRGGGRSDGASARKKARKAAGKPSA